MSLPLMWYTKSIFHKKNQENVCYLIFNRLTSKAGEDKNFSSKYCTVFLLNTWQSEKIFLFKFAMSIVNYIKSCVKQFCMLMDNYKPKGYCSCKI